MQWCIWQKIEQLREQISGTVLKTNNPQAQGWECLNMRVKDGGFPEKTQLCGPHTPKQDAEALDYTKSLLAPL